MSRAARPAERDALEALGSLAVAVGYLLVAVLFGVYSLAGQVSTIAGLSALVLVAAIAPALLRSSMRFRLSSTSWRGMRFVFSGSTGDAYRAMPHRQTILMNRSDLARAGSGILPMSCAGDVSMMELIKQHTPANQEETS